jgi:uncharacterized protein YigA (DUF484 family)
MTIRADDVAHYLHSNPRFFDEYADLLGQLVIPHPQHGRAISITERQMLALRDRNRNLEGKLSELLQFGEDNDVISERMHRLSVALVAATSLTGVLRAVHFQLREDFSVPHVALCFWDRPANLTEDAAYVVVDDALQVLGESLQQAYCGTTQGFEAVRWFGESADRVKSQALIALSHDGRTVGMLALGAEEADRFFKDMGTLYLDRLGDIVSAALGRCIPDPD